MVRSYALRRGAPSTLYTLHRDAELKLNICSYSVSFVLNTIWFVSREKGGLWDVMESGGDMRCGGWDVEWWMG